MFYNLNPTYLIFALPGLILAIIAQILIKVRYNKYTKQSGGTNITGLEAANIIKQQLNFPVEIYTSQGRLQDHFDPRDDTVKISTDNTTSESISNIAVVAHEFGHVQQKFSASTLFKIRSFMVPVVNIGSNLGYILFFIGLFINALNLSEIGLLLFSTTLIFALITLPIEFDASKRGMKFIKNYKLINVDKQKYARKILNAAALSYVAGFVTSLGNILYYASILSGRKRRN